MLDRKEMVNDDLRIMRFLGKVIDINDPIKRGRAKIRVFAKFDDLADDDLPWAQPRMSGTFGTGGGSGQISVPRVGAVVCVEFDNGNVYSPYFYNIQEPSPDMMADISGSYEGAQSLIYDGDEKLKVYYTRKGGLMLYLQGSTVNIATDSTITLTHAGSSSIIEMRGNNITITADSQITMTAGSLVKLTAPEVYVDGKETKLGHIPAYSAVLAEPLFQALKILAAACDSKNPPTPSAMTTMVSMAEQLSTSSTVKVSK